MYPTGDDWHLHMLCLINACLGQLSNNFRLVSLKLTKKNWLVQIVLEQKKQDDIEAVEQIFEDYCLCVEESIQTWKMNGEVKFSTCIDLKIALDLQFSQEAISSEAVDYVRWIYSRKE